ncbi:hypothetical protein FNF31_01612 [Cafeteria roenbergensis]|uniref:Uncharacterized protein n=2 Tax=Cafeteria roenbergensis TaxID=33653 RepID=A0A5A8DL93_CAFRO|nr:hypothetical protein FNF31_01612 [Cafeteria roenbergensis]
MATPASGALAALEEEADSQLLMLVDEARQGLELEAEADKMRQQIEEQLRALRQAHRDALGNGPGGELKSPARQEPPIVQLRRLLVKQDEAMEAQRKRAERLKKRLEQRLKETSAVLAGVDDARRRLNEQRQHRVDMDVVYDRLSKDAVRAVRACAETRARLAEATEERDALQEQAAELRAVVEAVNADMKRLEDSPPSNPVVDSLARAGSTGGGARTADGEAASLQALLVGKPRLTIREEMGLDEDALAAGADESREAAATLRAAGAGSSQTAAAILAAAAGNIPRDALLLSARNGMGPGGHRALDSRGSEGALVTFRSGAAAVAAAAGGAGGASRGLTGSRSVPALPGAGAGATSGGGAGRPGSRGRRAGSSWGGVMEPLGAAGRRPTSGSSAGRPLSRGAASVALLQPMAAGRLAARALEHHGATVARTAPLTAQGAYGDVLDLDRFRAEQEAKLAAEAEAEAEYEITLDAAELGRRVRGRGSDLRAAQRAAMGAASVAEARQAVGIGSVSVGLAHLYLHRGRGGAGAGQAGDVGLGSGRRALLGHSLRPALGRIDAEVSRSIAEAEAGRGLALTSAAAAEAVASAEAAEAAAFVDSQPEGREQDAHTKSALAERLLWDGIRTRLKGEASSAKFEAFRQQMLEADRLRRERANALRNTAQLGQQSRAPSRGSRKPTWREVGRALETPTGVADLVRDRQDHAKARATRERESTEGRREAVRFELEDIARERAAMEEAAGALLKLCVLSQDSPEELLEGERRREKEVEGLAEQVTAATEAVAEAEEAWREAQQALEKQRETRLASLTEGGAERKRRQLEQLATRRKAELGRVNREEAAARRVIGRVVRMLAEGAEETEPQAVAHALPLAQAAADRRSGGRAHVPAQPQQPALPGPRRAGEDARLRSPVTLVGGRSGRGGAGSGGGGAGFAGDRDRDRDRGGGGGGSPMVVGLGSRGQVPVPLPYPRGGVAASAGIAGLELPVSIGRGGSSRGLAGPSPHAGDTVAFAPTRRPSPLQFAESLAPSAGPFAGAGPGTVSPTSSGDGSSSPLRRARSYSLLRIARAASVASPHEDDAATMSPFGRAAAAQQLAGSEEALPRGRLGRARTLDDLGIGLLTPDAASGAQTGSAGGAAGAAGDGQPTFDNMPLHSTPAAAAAAARAASGREADRGTLESAPAAGGAAPGRLPLAARPQSARSDEGQGVANDSAGGATGSTRKLSVDNAELRRGAARQGVGAAHTESGSDATDLSDAAGVVSAASGLARGRGDQSTPQSSTSVRRRGKGGRRRSLVEGLALTAIKRATEAADSASVTGPEQSPSRMSSADLADRMRDTLFPSSRRGQARSSVASSSLPDGGVGHVSEMSVRRGRGGGGGGGDAVGRGVAGGGASQSPDRRLDRRAGGVGVSQTGSPGHSPSRPVGGTVKLAGIFEPSLPELEADAGLDDVGVGGGGGDDDDDDEGGEFVYGDESFVEGVEGGEGQSAGRRGAAAGRRSEQGALDAAGALRWVQQLESFVAEVQALEALIAARHAQREAAASQAESGGSSVANATDRDASDGGEEEQEEEEEEEGERAARATRAGRDGPRKSDRARGEAVAGGGGRIAGAAAGGGAAAARAKRAAAGPTTASAGPRRAAARTATWKHR